MQKILIPQIALLTGNKIPILGYGTYQLREAECINGTSAALKMGYTHIDTASIYRNESEIKKAIQLTEMSRENLYITSKISPAQQGKKESREAINTIIESMGCKYLDLILIHWPGAAKLKPQNPKNAQIRLQTWQTFIQLQKEGKLKDIGVSNFLKHHLQHLIKKSGVVPAVNQFEIHPLLWEGPTIDLCREYKIAIQAYSPLARQDDKLFKDHTMLQIAAKHSKSVAQISLRWCIQHGFIVLPKSKSAERIAENMNIFSFQLSNEEMGKINELNKKKVRTCWNPNNVIY